MEQYLIERNRSYAVRVKAGSRVRALRELGAYRRTAPGEYEHTTVPAGTVLTVVTESNAGFRGIEFFAEFEGYYVSASTGAVEIVKR